LAKLDRLSLLPALGFDRILIPGSVHKELWGKIGRESRAIDAALNDFIQVESAPHTEEKQEAPLANLDQGIRVKRRRWIVGHPPNVAVAPALTEGRRIAHFLVDALRYERAAEFRQRLPDTLKISP